jgi:hypothetical protein
MPGPPRTTPKEVAVSNFDDIVSESLGDLTDAETAVTDPRDVVGMDDSDGDHLSLKYAEKTCALGHVHAQIYVRTAGGRTGTFAMSYSGTEQVIAWLQERLAKARENGAV